MTKGLTTAHQFRETDWRIRAPVPTLVAIMALTRYIFRSRYLYDIDSVNFALALRRFDPAAHQPHPPGYFLYVWLGRLVNSFIPDANAALIAISIAASCGALGMIYLLTQEWFGRGAALFAGTLFIFSPLAWFHGTVALTYAAETFFSALMGYLCWKKSVLWSALVLGIAAGFRPSSLLFLGPLFFFALWKTPWRSRLMGIAILVGTLVAWFLPMLLESGGFSAWWSATMSLWSAVPATRTIFNSSIANSVARLLTVCFIGGLCFGCAAILPFLKSSIVRPALEMTFTWIWILPGLLFFTFVFLKFVNSGYLLVLSPPLFAWLGLMASEWYRSSRCLHTVAWSTFVVAFGVAFNVAIFLWAPLYCSYGRLRESERELQSVLTALPKVASPSDTMILGFDSHFMGYRHAGYYLPDYVTVEYPAVRVGAGRRIFTMRNGDTTLQPGLPDAPKNFILFPLPRQDPESNPYLTRIAAEIGAGDLGIVSSGGITFFTGPTSALPGLFNAHP